MKLVAMMIVRNELDRYLKPVIAALQEFCDEIRCYDDVSTDGTADWLEGQANVGVKRADGPSFYAHEGAARQKAMNWAHAADPTHVLAVDADELIENGQGIRDAIEREASLGRRTMVYTLDIQEIWGADDHYLYTREDGGWRTHPVPICYQAVKVVGNRKDWMIPQRQLASGRVPMAVARNGRKAPSGARCLHLGWACAADRQARYQRYVEHDQGRFHARAHLDSIMWDDGQVKTLARGWPSGLAAGRRDEILDRIRRKP